MRLSRNLLVAIVVTGIVAVVADAEERTGLVKDKPSSGRFVETDDGYMVAYTQTIPGTDIEYSMEPIPGGKFLMGSPESEEGRKPDEGPQVTVTIEPFWMGRCEVTWKEYKYFMSMYDYFLEFETKKIRLVTDDTKVDAITAPTPLYDPSFTFELGEEPDQPAVTMSQYAARQYTKWLSGITGDQYRLPAEAEWEYACRAGATTSFHFGDDAGKLGDYAWFYENADEVLHEVGQKKPNPWGLYDMHGNVWEWCLDQYLEDSYARLEGKAVDGLASVVWPEKQFPHVVRGGSWDDDPDGCRAAVKMASAEEWRETDPNFPKSPWWFTDYPARAVGFRLLRPLNERSREDIAKAWEPDDPVTNIEIESRYKKLGKFFLGIVDEELPAAIKKLESSN